MRFHIHPPLDGVTPYAPTARGAARPAAGQDAERTTRDEVRLLVDGGVGRLC